jgi:hypothetical protein
MLSIISYVMFLKLLVMDFIIDLYNGEFLEWNVTNEIVHPLKFQKESKSRTKSK